MAPKRLPWSVSASAGNLSSPAPATSLAGCAAPATRLYSGGARRWTESAGRPIRSPGRSRGREREGEGGGRGGLAVEAGRGDLRLHDRGGLAEEVQTVLGHVAQHPDREPGPRERLAPHDSGRESEELAELADLVLEELAERLDEPELHAGGQAPDVVGRLDRRPQAAGRDPLDHVGIA